MTQLSSTPPSGPKQSKFGLREAILLLVGATIGGGSVAAYMASKADADQPKQPGITDVSGGQSEGGERSNDEDNWPPNLISDINPLDYVDVDQCRALLFKMTGDLNCKALTLDEMRQKIHDIETEERLKIAENIIERFCISNMTDEDAIRNAVLNGCTRAEDDPISGGIDSPWYINLEDPSGEYCEGVELSEQPPCMRSLTDEEEKVRQELKSQAERVEAMVDSIKKDQFDGILTDIDIQELENEIRDKGVEEGIGGELIDMLKRTKGKLKGKMSSTERKILACEIMSFAISVEMEMDQNDESDLDGETSRELEGGPIMEKAFESMVELAESLIKAEGMEDPEECFLYMHKR